MLILKLLFIRLATVSTLEFVMSVKRTLSQIFVTALIALNAAVVTSDEASAAAPTWRYTATVGCWGTPVGMWIHQGANSGWATLSRSGNQSYWTYNLRPYQYYAVTVGCSYRGNPPSWPTSTYRYVIPAQSSNDWLCSESGRYSKICALS